MEGFCPGERAQDANVVNQGGSEEHVVLERSTDEESACSRHQVALVSPISAAEEGVPQLCDLRAEIETLSVKIQEQRSFFAEEQVSLAARLDEEQARWSADHASVVQRVQSLEDWQPSQSPEEPGTESTEMSLDVKKCGCSESGCEFFTGLEEERTQRKTDHASLVDQLQSLEEAVAAFTACLDDDSDEALSTRFVQLAEKHSLLSKDQAALIAVVNDMKIAANAVNCRVSALEERAEDANVAEQGEALAVRVEAVEELLRETQCSVDQRLSSLEAATALPERHEVLRVRIETLEEMVQLLPSLADESGSIAERVELVEEAVKASAPSSANGFNMRVQALEEEVRRLPALMSENTRHCESFAGRSEASEAIAQLTARQDHHTAEHSNMVDRIKSLEEAVGNLSANGQTSRHTGELSLASERSQTSERDSADPDTKPVKSDRARQTAFQQRIGLFEKREHLTR